jgi:hypothetical protein
VGEIRDILGKERVDRLKAMTKELIEEDVDPINVRDYVKAISKLYYDAKIEVAVTAAEVNVDVADSAEFDTEEESSQVEIIHFLYLFSELVMLLPNELWREAILAEVESAVKSKEGDSSTTRERQTSSLPELNEDELEEKFVRGSG